MTPELSDYMDEVIQRYAINQEPWLNLSPERRHKHSLEVRIKRSFDIIEKRFDSLEERLDAFINQLDHLVVKLRQLAKPQGSP